jgi:transcription antitermination factor NusG
VHTTAKPVEESPDAVSLVRGNILVEDLTENQWFALHIKSNLEKIAASNLESKGLTVYSPTFRVRKRWSDRMKEIDTPLFPGYVFCRFDPNDRLPVLTTHGVLNIVGIGGTPEAVTTDEILNVQKMVQGGRGGPWPFVQTGQRVLIERGPLAGTEGILIQTKDEYRIVVSINLLQRSVAAEIDIEMARPVGSTSRPPLNSTN